MCWHFMLSLLTWHDMNKFSAVSAIFGLPLKNKTRMCIVYIYIAVSSSLFDCKKYTKSWSMHCVELDCGRQATAKHT